MDNVINAGVFVIMILHLWFCILEMFLWQKPIGLKTFKLDAEFARRSAPLAANQGLYNAFLSAGLLWSLLSHNPSEAFHLKLFFLGCVVVAGVVGGLTVSYRILMIQALPAIAVLLLLAK